MRREEDYVGIDGIEIQGKKRRGRPKGGYWTM